MNKKGQNLNLIIMIVFGIASLVIGTIVAFTLISTLSGANLLQQGRTTGTVSNETGGWLNSSGYTLDSFDTWLHTAPSITAMRNGTDATVISAANYTINSNTGVVTNATALNWASIQIDYTYAIKTKEELSTTMMSTNFTAGVDNISSKIPTVLLIAAIVLILGVLAVLVGLWQKMKTGGGEL